MTTSLIVVGLGAVAAAVGTGALAGRCVRTPRIFLIAWTLAVFGLAVALAAQALGYLSGYSDPIFRGMEIGAQAVAPLGLCLGLVEMIGRSVPGRFAMRLAVSAIGVIVLVILGNDPLSTTTPLTSSWPDPAVFYQLIPAGLIDFLAVFTVATAVVSGLVVLVRSSRGPAFEAMVRPALTAAAAAVVIAVPGLMMLAHVRLSSAIFALTTVLAAALTWLAATTASRRGLADDRLADDRLAVDRAGHRQFGGQGWHESDAEPEDAGDRLDPVDDYLSSGYRDEAAYQGRRGSGAGRRDPDADIGYPALAALAAERSDHGQYESGELEPDPRAGVLEPYGDVAMNDSHRSRLAEGGDPPSQLFGQITIYTLLDDRLPEFDRMTERVVEEVRSREPGTLVYIVHAVPTAPMQRILYEVYRDRAAYDEHLARPYVMRYVAERRSMVLATNAIELGLQQAKVSALPSYSAISDILSESGIDLTGVTRASRGAAAGAAGHHGRPPPHEPPGSAPLRHGPGGQDADEPGYEGWAGLRDEDSWHR
ncbi:MAG TPA: antibiotic biosynthesis monooxygenase [Streptosporangiaceae bacterium]